MESYCLKCKKYTKNINPQISSTSNGKMILLSKCAICESKKSRFIKKRSKRIIKKPFSKLPKLGDILF